MKLAEVKRIINIGDKVVVRNYLKDTEEEREITGKNTVSISTFSPTLKSFKNEKGTNIILKWQKAKHTRVVDNKVQFLINKEVMGDYEIEQFINRGLDYWLELELLEVK